MIVIVIGLPLPPTNTHILRHRHRRRQRHRHRRRRGPRPLSLIAPISLSACRSIGVCLCISITALARIGNIPLARTLPPCARSCSPSFQFPTCHFPTTRRDTTRYRHDARHPTSHCRSRSVSITLRDQPSLSPSFPPDISRHHDAVTTTTLARNSHSQSSRNIALDFGFGQLSSRPVVPLVNIVVNVSVLLCARLCRVEEIIRS